MNWLSLFAKNENITPAETREYISSRPPGSYQLLDVRQPKEYEQSHIPGAILIPVGELPDRLGELNPELETIVYWRSGVRSRAGSQILTKANFSKVLNMTSGINGWEGHQAAGGEELGLEYFIQGDFDSAAQMAYNMEMGLQQFYQLLADRSESKENKDLLEFMARLEDGHMAKLRAQCSETELDQARQTAAIAEGGIRLDEFMATYGDQLQDIESIIQTGMMFETQAYDMYSRLARKSEKSELSEFYLQMAAEERRHLNTLASELEKRLG